MAEAHVVGGGNGLAVVEALLGDEGVDSVEVGRIVAGLHVQVLTKVGSARVLQRAERDKVIGPLLGTGGQIVVPDEVSVSDGLSGSVVGVKGVLLVGRQAGGGSGSSRLGCGSGLHSDNGLGRRSLLGDQSGCGRDHSGRRDLGDGESDLGGSGSHDGDNLGVVLGVHIVRAVGESPGCGVGSQSGNDEGGETHLEILVTGTWG